jgi:hypothetical protein
MDYSISITPHDNYLHIAVKGTSNANNALNVWKQIADACKHYGCYKILGEQYLVNAFSTVEALEFPTIFKQVGISSTHRIAWVDNNTRTRETTNFIRDILTNRSVGYGRVFTDINKAKEWLLKVNA